MTFKHEILLNSFNRPLMIKETLLSIYKQRNIDPDLLLIRVLDDNSKKEVKDEILKILTDSPFPFKFTTTDISDKNRYKNSRYAVRINNGLEASFEEAAYPEQVIIHYLTDDSLMYPEKIFKHAEQYQNGAKIVYNMTNRVCVMKVAKKILKQYTALTIGAPFNADRLCTTPGENYIDHIALSHRLDLLNLLDMPYWDESSAAWMAGDWIFWNRLVNLNIEFEYIEEPLDEKWWHNKCVQFESEHGVGLNEGSVGQKLLRE